MQSSFDELNFYINFFNVELQTDVLILMIIHMYHFIAFIRSPYFLKLLFFSRGKVKVYFLCPENDLPDVYFRIRC